MKFFYTALQFIKFIFAARNTKGHGVHSPYMFDFFQNVIYEKMPFYCFEKIENQRNILENDYNILEIKDLGTLKSRIERVGDVARRSLKSPRYAQMLFRAVNFSKSSTVLELGSSLGITTAYLASPPSVVRCLTMEGSPEIAKQARKNFKALNINNIEIVEGNIDDTLQPTLDKYFEKIDFVFIDANHKCEAVMRYFQAILPRLTENSALIIDDIYWSKDMTAAWNMIKDYESVSCTIDLFQMGFVFFNKNLPKKHYKAL